MDFLDDLVRWQCRDILTVIDDLSFAGFCYAANGHHGGGFASTVGADNCHDFPTVDIQINTAQSDNLAIVGFNAL